VGCKWLHLLITHYRSCHVRERDTKDGNQPSHHTDPAKDYGVPSALRATLPSSLGGFAVHTLCLVWRVGRLRVMARRAVSIHLPRDRILWNASSSSRDIPDLYLGTWVHAYITWLSPSYTIHFLAPAVTAIPK
jgi:hypothetical protein